MTFKFDRSASEVVERYYRMSDKSFIPSLEFPDGKMRLFIASPYRRFWKSPRDWKIILHQYCGLACDHIVFYGKELSFLPNVELMFRGIHQSWEDAAAIFGPVPLKDVMGYAKVLENLGLSCDASYVDLNEALYPIDFSAVSIKFLTGLDLDYDDLIKSSGLPLGSLKLYVLGENSD